MNENDLEGIDDLDETLAEGLHQLKLFIQLLQGMMIIFDSGFKPLALKRLWKRIAPFNDFILNEDLKVVLTDLGKIGTYIQKVKLGPRIMRYLARYEESQKE